MCNLHKVSILLFKRFRILLTYPPKLSNMVAELIPKLFIPFPSIQILFLKKLLYLVMCKNIMESVTQQENPGKHLFHNLETFSLKILNLMTLGPIYIKIFYLALQHFPIFIFNIIFIIFTLNYFSEKIIFMKIY